MSTVMAGKRPGTSLSNRSVESQPVTVSYQGTAPEMPFDATVTGFDRCRRALKPIYRVRFGTAEAVP